MLWIHNPIRLPRHSRGYLLERTLAVELFKHAVEKFRELDKLVVTLDKPLPILETVLLQFANELDIRSKSRALWHLQSSDWPHLPGLRSCLRGSKIKTGFRSFIVVCRWLVFDHYSWRSQDHSQRSTLTPTATFSF